MRSTPALALEAFLNVLPLDVMIEELAMKACRRLMKAETWIGINQGGPNNPHKQIENITVKFTEKDDNSDDCDRVWNEDRKFKININDRKNWGYGMYIKNNINCWVH